MSALDTTVLILAVALPGLGFLGYLLYTSIYSKRLAIFEYMKVTSQDGKQSNLIWTGKITNSRIKYTDKSNTKLNNLGSKIKCSKDMLCQIGNKFVVGRCNDQLIPIKFSFDGTQAFIEMVPNILRHDCSMMEQEEAIEFNPNNKWYQNPIVIAIIWVMIITAATCAWVWIMWKFSKPDLTALQANTNMIEKLANTLSGQTGGAPA